MDYAPEEVLSKSLLSVKQDVKLLGENIINLGGIWP
jgi:3-oxoacyl-[acyl-carrier-protein] synthase-3